jgi:RNA polymerase sigma-70 factor (ECF subfamily)
MDDQRGLAAAPLSPPSDAELLRRIQTDDLDAFELFFERYRRNVYRTSFGLLGDRCAAEEVLLDTFARAYRHRATLRLDVSPLPWLNRVAMNLGYSRHARRRLPTQGIDDAVAATLRDGSMQPEARAEQAELQQAVRRGIAALPEKQRSVVVLYYLQEMSLQETATSLGVALGTVKSRLHYAIQALRLHLEAEEPQPAADFGVLAARARREARL